MNFKSRENELIWESMMGMPPQDPTQENDEDQYGVEDFNPEDQEEVVMTIDQPTEPVEAVLEPEESSCGCGGGLEIDIDDEDGMSNLVSMELGKLSRHTQRLSDYAKSGSLEPWMQAKVLKAVMYLADVCDALDLDADFANDQSPDVEL